MRNIADCVNAFLPLLNMEYEPVLGRKCVAVKIHLVFDKFQKLSVKKSVEIISVF